MNRPPLLFDASHTSHTTAQTGVQRVCRTLYSLLTASRPVVPVCYDPHLRNWRTLDAGEETMLRDRSGGGKSRGAKWSLGRKLRGHARRWLGHQSTLPASGGLICPEIISAKVGAHLPRLLATTAGPRVAIFYDAIPLKFPEMTPPGTVERFPAYLRELLRFDGVAAISEDSASALRDYWQWLGVTDAPPVHAISLAIDAAHPEAGPMDAAVGTRPRVLCVCTLEGRKNHLALLAACENLWGEGIDFELELIGLPRPDTAAAAIARIHALQQAGRPLRFTGAVPEAELWAAYRHCAFTVYPSVIEGFGLPVLESLQHGKPCVCSGRGALGEISHGGGCIPLDTVDAPGLTDAIRRLLHDPGSLAVLAGAARTRHLKTWTEYTTEFTAWMDTLPRRN